MIGSGEEELENGSAAKRKRHGVSAGAGKKQQPTMSAAAAGSDKEAGGSSSDEGSEGFHEVQGESLHIHLTEQSICVFTSLPNAHVPAGMISHERRV